MSRDSMCNRLNRDYSKISQTSFSRFDFHENIIFLPTRRWYVLEKTLGNVSLFKTWLTFQIAFVSYSKETFIFKAQGMFFYFCLLTFHISHLTQGLDVYLMFIYLPVLPEIPLFRDLFQ